MPAGLLARWPIGSNGGAWSAALDELVHQSAQIVEVACQAIHAVHHHRVALAHEGDQPFQLGAMGILTRCLIGEHLVHLDMFELSFRILIEAADADVADALTVQDGLLRTMCQDEIYDP